MQLWNLSVWSSVEDPKISSHTLQSINTTAHHKNTQIIKELKISMVTTAGKTERL